MPGYPCSGNSQGVAYNDFVTTTRPARGARPARGMRSRAWWASAPLVAGLCVVLVAAVPAASGSSWALVVDEVAGIQFRWVLALALAWWAGLWAHSVVLTASLPGLTSRRAIGLNLAGSAVGNAVPLGGALSLGLTSTMVRSWGFAPRALGTFLTVSTAWNLLARLLGGIGGLVWVTTSLPGVSGTRSAAWLAGTALILLAVTALACTRDSLAARLGATLGRLAQRLPRARPDVDPHCAALAAVRLRRQVAGTVARTWQWLSLGMVGYLAFLVVLLWCCLHSIGAQLPLAAVVAAVTLERLVTAVPITPGGAGVAELVLTSCLALAGAAPAQAAAAALIYRAFTFFLEIPLGLAVTGAWGWGRWRAQRRVFAAAT